MNTFIWEKALSNFSFSSDEEIHIWYARFEDLAKHTEIYRSYLSADESERANNFYFASDQESFMIARGSLRKLLGLYLQKAPESLQFIYGENQKPFLANHALQFNLAHTRQVFLIGITKKNKIGVDLESIERSIDIQGIMEHSLSEEEKKYVESRDSFKKKEAFYRCWARKEAYLKAIGIGIGGDLKSITVTNTEESFLMLKREKKEWQVIDLPSRDKCMMALSMEGDSRKKVFCYDNLI